MIRWTDTEWRHFFDLVGYCRVLREQAVGTEWETTPDTTYGDGGVVGNAISHGSSRENRALITNEMTTPHVGEIQGHQARSNRARRLTPLYDSPTPEALALEAEAREAAVAVAGPCPGEGWTLDREKNGRFVWRDPHYGHMKGEYRRTWSVCPDVCLPKRLRRDMANVRNTHIRDRAKVAAEKFGVAL